MATFLKLTDYDTRGPLWVNPGHVVVVAPVDNFTTVRTTLGAALLRVAEPADRVALALEAGADAIAENGELVFDEGDDEAEGRA